MGTGEGGGSGWAVCLDTSDVTHTAKPRQGSPTCSKAAIIARRRCQLLSVADEVTVGGRAAGLPVLGLAVAFNLQVSTAV